MTSRTAGRIACGVLAAAVVLAAPHAPGVTAGAASAQAASAQNVSAQNASVQSAPRTFKTADDAARELIRIAKAGNLQELLALFGADGQDLVAGSDPATARRNREVFTAAAAEGWRLEGDDSRKTLVIGNEKWPFPVSVVKAGAAWRFDTAAGREEVMARRVGRNELAVIEISRTYVLAQRLYAQQSHDGKPAGLYAQTFRSAVGKQNGLYWPATQGQKVSPLGDLLAQAAEQERPAGGGAGEPSPFQGYYFKIVTGQGAAAGGQKSYVVNGEMSGGFALVAWPAQYDVTGVMTFIVNQDGVVYQKDLGPGTESTARSMTLFNPDASWQKVAQQPD